MCMAVYTERARERESESGRAGAREGEGGREGGTEGGREGEREREKQHMHQSNCGAHFYTARGVAALVPQQRNTNSRLQG